MKLPGRIILAVMLGLLGAEAALAQTWPAKPVRIIIPTPPGGPLDNLTRAVAQSAAQVFGQPFLVENRVGADSIIAVEACAKSAADGLTLCSVDSFAITLNPVVRSKLPYDPDRDLAPVIQYGTLASALSVHPSVPAGSVRELLELARSKPGAVAFGTYGLASANHLYVEWLRNTRGIVFLDVPYKAASQAMQALLAGEVQVVAFALAPSMAQARAGKMRILAVAGDERSPALPDVQSFKEAGLEVSIRTWFGMFAPAGTSREIIQRLNAEVARVLLAPPFKEKFLTSQGMETSSPAAASPEAFAAYIKQERDMYANLVKVVGLKLD